MDSNPNASLHSCLVYFGGDKPMKTGNLGQVHNIVQDGCVLNELNTNGCLGLHVGKQFPYAPYGMLALPDDKKSKHEMEMDLQNHHMDYQVPSTMELSRSLFDKGHHDWSTEPSSYGLSIYHGNSFNQTNRASPYAVVLIFQPHDKISAGQSL